MLFTPWLSSVRSAARTTLRQTRRRSKYRSQSVSELLETRVLLTAPQFISVSPNVGDFLQDGAVRNDVPREFNFQFSPDQAIVGIDSTSLDALHVIGAGHDGGFTPANVITDLGTNGAVLLRIGSQRLGPNDNGDLLTVLSVDRAGNGPTIVRTNPATDDFALLTLTLDSNLTSPTTAQKLIDFAKNDPVAKQLLTVSLVSAPITASTILGTPPVAPLTLNGAGAASALSSFGVTGLNVLFQANQPGEDGNGILIQVNKLDFGAASSAPTVNVVGQRIEVVLNENPAAPTTVQGLLNAINSSTKASLLVSASRITGSATANIAAGTTDGSLIRFAGADRVISASIASGFQSTNGLLVQFAAKLTGTAGNDVSLLFQQPQPVSSSNISAPTINVSGKRITVTLNNNPTARTTADDLITALGLNAAASALITAKRVSSAATGTTDITTLASGTVLKLGGVDAAVAPGFSGVQPSNRDVVYRFGAPLTNDVYRIEIIGTGSTPLTNNMNEPVNGDGVTLGGKDVFRTFTLDLGAVVTSVVPQPVLREQLLTVSNVARITDGDTLTVDPGNGTRLFVFEFNSGALNNIRPGNFEIPFTTLMTQAAVATAISTAINNATLASPDVVATATGATVSLVGGAFDVRAKLTLNPNASPVGLTLRAGAVIKQSLDQIQVYFNNDDLVDTATVAENPAFYQLINTKGTSSALDDTISLPMNVAYDANLDVATLTFSGNIPIGTFSLKIGSSQELDSTLLSAVKLGTLSAGPGFTRSAFTGDNGTGSADLDHYQFELPAAGDLVVTATPDAAHDTVIRLFNSAGASVGSAVLVNNAAGAGDTLTAVGLTAGTYYAEVGTSTTTTGSYLLNISTTAMLASSDKNSSYASASNLGSLGAAGATVVASIDSSLSIPVPPLPGDDTPGHRNIPAEAHGGGSGTTPATPGGIAVIRYNFADVYGFDPQGNILHNQITAGQKQRTREIFEIFSRYAGIQSEETANSGFQIVTGDLRALDPTIPVNSVAGLGGGSPIIINALGTLGSDDVYDGAWMSVAFHEIGHSLGLGHTTDLHSLQSGNGNSVTAETPTSDYDNQHLASLYSPFSNDIDLYKFTVSQAGRISAGIAAELQTPTSKLDSVLTLFRDPFATASSDFGTSGMTASSVNFTSAIAGTVGNSVRVIVLTNDVGGVGVPTVSVLGHDITLTLNTNLGNQTTASQVVAAINGNAAASLLLSASFTGADSNVTGIAPGSSTIALKGGNREQIARNDDYNSNDSLISVDLLPGTYYIGVSAKGNSGYDPTVADSGYGGQSEGAYRLNVSFAAAPASSLLDQDEPLFPATVLDGDADRIAGGQFAFWFESGNTIYVDKITSIPVAQQDGTLAKPFSTIGAAIKMASSRIVVPTTGAAGINDGDYFTINDGTNPTDVFEFDKLGDGVVASNRPIAINPGDTPAQVATKIATAINAERTLNRILSQATATNDHVDITNVTTLDASAAVALITAQNLVRILSNGGTDADRATAGDNTPYLIGVNNVGGTLADGRNFDVPQGVTVMVDAGTIIKLQSANIDVGTSAFGLDRRGGSVQLLGTPEHVGTGNSAVYLTSFRNDAVGGDSDGASAGVSPGQWGGLVFRHDSDMTISQNNDVFLNSVYQSDISYGGGQVTVNSVAEVFDPIHIISNRPTVAFSLITNSADAAISADPDSFDDSLDRIGPDVHGNLLFNNSINGLFVRIKTQFGAPVDKLNVRARFDDTDITHIITENLLITGNPGGSILSNEQQQLVVLGSPSGGTFTLSFSGGFAQPTTPLTKAVGVSALTQTVGSTTLSAAILTNLQTSITVSSLAGLPTADANPATIDFTISIGGEQMAVTNINVATRVLTVTRGINGTTRIATAAIGTAVLQTSFAVAAGNLFAVADGSAATIDFTVNIAGEQMAVTNVVGNVFTVTRAINGTTAANHSIGNTVLQTSLAVSNAANLPPITNPGSVNFNVTVGSEDMGVTNIVGNTLTVVRGVNGTTPAISAVGTTVSRSRISAPLSFNASALEIQRALESLEGIGPGGVRVTGGPIPQAAVQLEFTNQQGGFNHPAVVVNNSQLSNGSLLVTTVGNGGISMARPGGRLQVDPGIVVKLNGARIEGERGSSQLIAEGTSIDPIIFTSLKDDRFGGASGSFDSSSDGFQTTSLVGDWGGLMFNVGSRISLDHVYLANAGGQTPIEGGSGSFNPIEIHEATLRLTNSTFEDNTDGASIPGSRNNRETNVPATVFVRGAQSIIVNNVFHNNVGAAISIDANALKAINIVDPGRETGLRDAFSQFADNQGPLVRLNRLQNEILGAGNILGLQVRSGPLDTATVWDDTDIVHVVTAGNISNNYSFHVSGGLRLVSAPNASLVVKLGVGAGFENGNPDSDGNNIPDEGPLDISDRIGAAMQILGAPGFPVIITSLRDDTVGASLDLSGLPHLDTNGDGGASTPASGDWNEILFDKYSNDTNMVVVYESEKALTGGIDVNSAPGTSGSSQFIGDLAPNLKSSNENRRAGFEVHGHISEDASSDVDVYSFSADVGTEVWLDIDNTNPALDTILELVNAAGTVLARSQDNGTLQSFSVTATSLQKTPSLGGDFYATTIRDAGMRVVLPGIAGTSGTYFVRIRSNPVASSINDLQGGLTSGQYQLQLRLQQSDQQPGVAAKFSDIRYATNGLHVRGLPYHSPLTGESGEAGTSDPANDFVAGAIDLGNLLSSDRGSLTAGGALTGNGDIDFYRFRIDYQKIQSIAGVNGGGKTWATVIDLDWADGLTRPDTSFAIFDEVGRLIYIGRDSNVAIEAVMERLNNRPRETRGFK